MGRGGSGHVMYGANAVISGSPASLRSPVRATPINTNPDGSISSYQGLISYSGWRGTCEQLESMLNNYCRERKMKFVPLPEETTGIRKQSRKAFVIGRDAESVQQFTAFADGLPKRFNAESSYRHCIYDSSAVVPEQLRYDPDALPVPQI